MIMTTVEMNHYIVMQFQDAIWFKVIFCGFVRFEMGESRTGTPQQG